MQTYSETLNFPFQFSFNISTPVRAQFFFLFLFNLFFYRGMIALQNFLVFCQSSFSKQDSGCTAPSLQPAGSSMCRARLSCPVAGRVFVPPPGIEPTSPALEGGFLSPGPPGKSQGPLLNSRHLLMSVQRREDAAAADWRLEGRAPVSAGS